MSVKGCCGRESNNSRKTPITSVVTGITVNENAVQAVGILLQANKTPLPRLGPNFSLPCFLCAIQAISHDRLLWLCAMHRQPGNL